MTRKKILVIFVIFTVIILLVMFPYRAKKPSGSPLTTSPQVATPVLDFQKITFNGKKVVGLKPGKEKEQLEKLKVVNTESPDWKPNLEKTLRLQGGDALTSVDIKKVDSLIWTQDNLAYNVESVIVKVKKKDNFETSFKALIDSQTGKILQTWDQPIFDPIHPKDRFKVKIDPRYHND